MLHNPANKVHNIQLVSENLAIVKYTKIEEFVEDLGTASVVVASWVTAQARLKLYTYLEQLGDRVLYMDTGWLYLLFFIVTVTVTVTFELQIL